MQTFLSEQPEEQNKDKITFMSVNKGCRFDGV